MIRRMKTCGCSSGNGVYDDSHDAGSDDNSLCSKCKNRLFRSIGNRGRQDQGEYEDNQQR